MSHETAVGSDVKVQKRNGQLVPFNVWRIKNAIANAFKDVNLTIEWQRIHIFLRGDVSQQSRRCNALFDRLCRFGGGK